MLLERQSLIELGLSFRSLSTILELRFLVSETKYRTWFDENNLNINKPLEDKNKLHQNYLGTPDEDKKTLTAVSEKDKTITPKKGTTNEK